MYVFQSKLMNYEVSPNGDRIFTISYIAEKDSQIIANDECVCTLTTDVGIVHDEEYFNSVGYDDKLRTKLKDHLERFVIKKSAEFK